MDGQKANLMLPENKFNPDPDSQSETYLANGHYSDMSLNMAAFVVGALIHAECIHVDFRKPDGTDNMVLATRLVAAILSTWQVSLKAGDAPGMPFDW